MENIASSLARSSYDPAIPAFYGYHAPEMAYLAQAVTV